MKFFLTSLLAFLATMATFTSASTSDLHGPIEMDKDHGLIGTVEVAHPEDIERETFLFSICYNLEQVFSHQVKCKCTPELATFTIKYVCSERSRQSFADVSLTPQYTGLIAIRLGALQLGFGSGTCGGEMVIDTKDYGKLNFGDFCFQFRYSLSLRPFGIQVDSCDLQLGVLGSCATCTPCTTPKGKPGVSFKCDKQGLGTNQCIESTTSMAARIGNTRGAVNGDIFGLLDYDELVRRAVEEGKVEVKEKKDPAPYVPVEKGGWLGAIITMFTNKADSEKEGGN